MRERESRIALAAPDNPATFRSSQIRKENLALGYLAAQLETLGHKVEIYDARLFKASPETISEEITQFNPALIGISLIAEETSEWSARLASSLRQSGVQAHITLGGYFPSLQPKRALELIPEANSVVIGEGEITLSELVYRLTNQQEWIGIPGSVSRQQNGEIVYGSLRPLVENLNSLPFPRRYGLSQIPEFSIEGSRGCFHHCTFCAIGPHFRATPRLAWRGRSPEHIVEEMVQLKEKAPHINQFRFVDPDFIAAHGKAAETRLFKLAQLIKSRLPEIQIFMETRPDNVKNKNLFRALKEAGLTEVYIGVESGSEKILNRMHKGFSLEQVRKAINLLNDLDIDLQYGFMMFTPWSGEKDIKASIAFLREIGAVQIDKLFYDMYAIPGTPAINQLKAMGMESIKEIANTGYLRQAPPLVRRLRLIGKLLESDHFDFLMELWLLFKTIRPYLRKRISWAKNLEKEISCLYLDIFDYCFAASKSIHSENPEVINQILNSCIQKFKPRVEKLTKQLSSRANLYQS